MPIELKYVVHQIEQINKKFRNVKVKTLRWHPSSK